MGVGGSRNFCLGPGHSCAASRELNMGHETWHGEIRGNTLLGQKYSDRINCHQRAGSDLLILFISDGAQLLASRALNLCRVSRSSSSRGMGQAALLLTDFRQSTDSGDLLPTKMLTPATRRKAGNAIGIFV